MKKFVASFCTLFGALLLISSAHASMKGPLTCSLDFKAKGGGAQIGLGYFKLKGHGEVTCFDIHGETETRSVKITVGGHPIAPRIGFGYMKLYGSSLSFGLDGCMDELYGHYLMADAQSAVGLGAGASFSIENPLNGLNISLGTNGIVGLGVEFGFSTFTIEAI